MVALISRTCEQSPTFCHLVATIKEECLDRLIPFGERQCRGAVAEFVAIISACGIIRTGLVASGFSLKMPCQLRGTSKCPSLRNFGASIRAV